MFNFEPQDIKKCTRYDGFISPNGDYYIVKERRNSMSMIGHNEWAKEYMKIKNLRTFQINQSYSMLLALSKLNGPAEYLIHCFGFIYYSHDPILYKPIIILPKKSIFGLTATSSQMDSLYEIMTLNHEHPENLLIFIDSNIDSYCGLDEGGKIR